ncbi:MAG: DEAD/DEAH box helicase [Acidimicrobiales bacterium]
MTRTDALSSFHPALAEWFSRSFPEGPTPAQALGWPTIARGENTLIAAPTGSGKTLAAFLVAIDRCLRREAGDHEARTSVVYVSPLRALTVDVAENLESPLEKIAALGDEIGEPLRPIRVAVRNGDTPQSVRQAMVREPPDIVVTTPESLYLLATSRRGRAMLSTVETVIVDEIHALARDKRGSHLALTLERLDRIVTSSGRPRPTRIGCSATQRPISAIARLLVGAGDDRSTPDGAARCAIIDVGHRRELDMAITLPTDELGAVMTTEQLDEIVSSLAEEIESHHTTLVFVNTRKMAERVAHLLRGVLGDDAVASHHGSLSMERRLSVETRLREGRLRAVVATASLELGIDVGPVDLVCQIGSPRAIATFLQRVGRADHRRNGVPKGRVYPMTRDELVECVALFCAVRSDVLDAVHPPVAPLDILAQQIVAEVAASGDEGTGEKELESLVRHAAPYEGLGADDFEAVVVLVSEGVRTGRGVRGAYVHRDRVNHVLKGRRGAGLAAVTSGGAIPELADYRVVTDPDESLVGSVHEDFAVEAMTGDVFLLGSHSWRVRRVEQGVVRVTDAQGAAPTIPFWLGEAPARTDELSTALSDLRQLVEDAITEGGATLASARVEEHSGVERRVASECVAYLAAALAQLGTLPTKKNLVVERFFDDTGGAQLVVHSPYGARINRGLGLALRKRFCRTFDFELQAAASDDAVVLSLGPQHSFALESVLRFVTAEDVREALVQAVLPTPIFTSRWRWNLGRSLVSPRFRGARHLPPAIQRMEADDLMAAIFPMLAACQENVTGPIEVPDHLIVRQTIDDCMTEAMDLEGLITLLEHLRDQSVTGVTLDTTEPSILTHEILNGRPYTFLDDAPLEERRTRAVALSRGVPLEARDLSMIDESVIDEVRTEIVADPRDAEELHDLIEAVVILAPNDEWRASFEKLRSKGRAAEVIRIRDATDRYWCATERKREAELLLGPSRFQPDVVLPDAIAQTAGLGIDETIAAAVEGHLEIEGPASEAQLASALGGITEGSVASALAHIEARGAAMRLPDGRWWSRRLVARAHSRARDRSRRAVSTVSARDLVRFLLEWQHVSPGAQLSGVIGLAEVLGQLQGVEAPVGAWEQEILAARVRAYSPQLLDELCAHGEVAWGRLDVDSERAAPRRQGAAPSRATPVALVRREDLTWLIAAARGEGSRSPLGPGATAEIVEALRARGASFFSDLVDATGRLPTDVADALWDGVAHGLLTSDGFAAVRALLAGRYRAPGPSSPRLTRRIGPRPSAARRRLPPALSGGRWSLLSDAAASEFDPDELWDTVAIQLLERWGVVFRDLVAREPICSNWREVLYGLRRLEARGIARGGRFVGGFSGEQFALPEALDALARVARHEPDGSSVRISAADPLNLTGLILGVPRVPTAAGKTITLADGVVAYNAQLSPRAAAS